MGERNLRKKPLELEDIFKLEPFRFEKIGRPLLAFGQVWTVGPLDGWLGGEREMPLNIPVVIVNPDCRAGLLHTCSVMGLHELRSLSADDDIYCGMEDKLLDSFAIALWLACDVFPRHLDQCIGFLSDRTKQILLRRLANEKIDDPLRKISGAPIITDADQRLEYRAFMTKQFDAFTQPVKRYLAVWKKLNEALTRLDVREAEESIALQREIEQLLDSRTFSEQLIVLVRRAGEESFKDVSLQQIEEELRRIDNRLGAGTPESLRARLAFLHKCFEDSLNPEILSRLERELDDFHNPTG